jgi:PAS domain S-box-containing protein
MSKLYNLSNLAKLSIIICLISTLLLLTFQTFLALDLCNHTTQITYLNYFCTFLFLFSFAFLTRELTYSRSEIIRIHAYNRELSTALVSQSHNRAYFDGSTKSSSDSLTKEIIDTLGVDRASIWLYNQDRTSIICESLCLKNGAILDGIELHITDFEQYFKALKHNPIIIAHDAETHPATACFLESYLKPLGIKSMLDVPIIYKDEMIGIICIESTTKRKWFKSEIDFLQILSSLYSFAYSNMENNIVENELIEFEKFVSSSVLITRADKNGIITYANKKFIEVSGYALDEIIGQNHRIVNSGLHSKRFWDSMYKTTIKDKRIWNKIVINKNKSGELYWVDSYIIATFDSQTGEHTGFISIRQDITKQKKGEVEIRNRMNAINESNAVVEFDLKGNVMFANKLFIESMGYSSESEIVGKHHRIFVEDEFAKSKDYINFWEKIKHGTFFSGNIVRVRKDGSLIYLQATYNPIIDVENKVYRIMKIAIDITASVEQQKELEKKNTYLEHAAKILRHDMHSGINTYMPRGISSLERRISDEQAKELKIDAPLRMIKEGLRHTQKVYKGVYEFTNLVKKDVILNKTVCNLNSVLEDYLSATAYRPQVIMEDLGEANINESLFCTSIDNLIRNGLKYNDSASKYVKIYRIEDTLFVEDNGRGLNQEDFDHLSKPYIRKVGQKESGSGLGLNICIAILEEHGFSITCNKLPTIGTQMKIKLK